MLQMDLPATSTHPSPLLPPSSGPAPPSLMPQLSDGIMERTVADTMRFDGFGWALIECFLVFAGEGWSERMYAVMEHTGNGAAAVYYVFILVFGQCVSRAVAAAMCTRRRRRVFFCARLLCARAYFCSFAHSKAGGSSACRHAACAGPW